MGGGVFECHLGQADDSKRSRRYSHLLLAVGAFLARVLQMLVLHLEAAIEWLGHEPERRWEHLLFLRGMEVSAPNVPKLSRRAALLHERGDGEGALRLYVKILELEPDNTNTLDAAAEVLSELGCVPPRSALIGARMSTEASRRAWCSCPASLAAVERTACALLIWRAVWRRVPSGEARRALLRVAC
jgi:hypothetical protein